jgi:hypothetical protein
MPAEAGIHLFFGVKRVPRDGFQPSPEWHRDSGTDQPNLITL